MWHWLSPDLNSGRLFDLTLLEYEFISVISDEYTSIFRVQIVAEYISEDDMLPISTMLAVLMIPLQLQRAVDQHQGRWAEVFLQVHDTVVDVN